MKLFTGTSLSIREIFAVALASFLVVYHSVKVFMFFGGGSDSKIDVLLNSFNPDLPVIGIINTQVRLRMLIVVSLLGVIFRVKEGIFGMWLGITSLIMTQFILVQNAISESVVSAHSGLSPLKGFIIPSMITVLHQSLKYRLLFSKKVDANF